MDLLGDVPALNINDEEWRVYSRHEPHAPQYVGENALIDNSSVTEGCEIFGTVRNSVIGAGVVIEDGAVVENSVILDNVKVKSGAGVFYSIVDSGTVIGNDCVIGDAKADSHSIAVVGADICVPNGTKIGAGAMISKPADLEKEGK